MSPFEPVNCIPYYRNSVPSKPSPHPAIRIHPADRTSLPSSTLLDIPRVEPAQIQEHFGRIYMVPVSKFAAPSSTALRVTYLSAA